MEALDRGVVAVPIEDGMLISWRLLGTDRKSIGFHVFRNGEQLTDKPIKSSTNLVDPEGTSSDSYEVVVSNGKGKGKGAANGEQALVLNEQYLDVSIDKPADWTGPNGDTHEYTANDASIGDLDGDGHYELVLKWDANGKDNSHSGFTGPVFMDAYELDGTKLWRINLGTNIRAGAHYTQFMVYDLDGDGRSEVAMKTADGTIDGIGQVIGDPNADYRNDSGYVLEGDEFLTVFDGESGAALDTIAYEPPRGNVSSWGDNYGNRVDRFLAAVAYLDGKRPSLVMARGYYTRTVLVAYNFRDGHLDKQWTFDSDERGEQYEGQGFHNLSVGDVDGDHKDEIVFGAMTIDHDGDPLYNTKAGHGDAMHLGDLVPNRKGLEVFTVHENRPNDTGVALRDAKDGELIWAVPTTTDIGRGLAADIDPAYPGAEMWSSSDIGKLWSASGEVISDQHPAINFAIWWDGDPLREILDHNWKEPHGVGRIDKWNPDTQSAETLLTATGTYSNNWTKGNPALQADLWGDWREEAIWRTEDSTALRIYTTPYETDLRMTTLMHDPLYRLGVAWQNVAYNQPPHTSFFIGADMDTPPKSNIYTVPR
ncbi:rhamnogalacturonan lyase [Aureibacillus halotolerans]|nr:rhamnogalacturonan lyase [Aureibacillus halotolerans]